MGVCLVVVEAGSRIKKLTYARYLDFVGRASRANSDRERNLEIWRGPAVTVDFFYRRVMRASPSLALAGP